MKEQGTGLPIDTALGNTTSTTTFNQHAEPLTVSNALPGGGHFNESYARDALGRITSKTVQLAGASDQLAYTYDAAGRLTNVTRGGDQAEAYQYDENGNRTLTTYGSGAAQESIAATFDARDRMTTYGNLALSYNADGELTEKRNTADGDATSFTYSASGALTGAVTAGGDHLTYTYDALGNLVSRSKNGNTTGGFLYAPGITGPVAELGEDGDAEATFVYATRSNVPDYMVKAGRTYRLITDQIGSVRLVVDAETGSIEQEIEYDAFGRVMSDSAPGFQPFYFAGGLYDSATKLTHFGAREYDAELGRWTSADPISFAGGDGNLYGYVVGDPVNFFDPSGLFLEGITDAVGDVVGAVGEFWVGVGDRGTGGLTRKLRATYPGVFGDVEFCSTAYDAGGMVGLASVAYVTGAGAIAVSTRALGASARLAATAAAVAVANRVKHLEFLLRTKTYAPSKYFKLIKELYDLYSRSKGMH